MIKGTESANGPNEVCDPENKEVASTVTKRTGFPVGTDCKVGVS